MQKGTSVTSQHLFSVFLFEFPTKRKFTTEKNTALTCPMSTPVAAVVPVDVCLPQLTALYS